MSATNFDHALKLEVPIAVRVGERTMKVRDVMAWVPGSLIELTKQADDELDLIVNNRHCGFGNAVKVGENFGIRISFIGDVRVRLEAMSAEDETPSNESLGDVSALAEALLAGQG